MCLTTLESRDRPNNECETWNNTFRYMFGGVKKPRLWNVIECLAQDAILVSAEVLQVELRRGHKKRVKTGTKKHQKRLNKLCLQYNRQQKTLSKFTKDWMSTEEYTEE